MEKYSKISAISPLDEKAKMVKLIDQNKLPRKLTYMKCKNWEQIAVAIEQLSVRGAPAIGVAAAMGLALAALHSNGNDFDKEPPCCFGYIVTDIRSVPSFLNCSSALAVASSPQLINATTAAVPTKIPKTARKDLNFAADKLTNA